MGPVAGGQLASNSKILEELVPGVKRLPELALRFVLSNPNVSAAISGMSTMQHVEDNVRIASDPVSFTDEDKAALGEHLERMKKMSELYCTGCGYCMPCEAAEVAIPGIFAAYNLGRVYGLWDIARANYARIGVEAWCPGAKADACTECGICEEKCPQNIPIRKQLKEAHEALVLPGDKDAKE